jgi:membrane-associated phospholipid phosphatase
VAVSTVYGRYHYLADALAGLAVSVLAGGLIWAFTAQRRISSPVAAKEVQKF